jgi:hypothetical protein
MTFNEIIQQISHLTLAERKQLLRVITDTLPATENLPVPQKRSILEFEGVGKSMWQGVDAQEYVDHLRSEWDQRA